MDTIKLILCEEPGTTNQMPLTKKFTLPADKVSMEKYINEMCGKKYICHEFDYVKSFRSTMTVQEYTLDTTPS